MRHRRRISPLLLLPLLCMTLIIAGMFTQQAFAAEPSQGTGSALTVGATIKSRAAERAALRKAKAVKPGNTVSDRRSRRLELQRLRLHGIVENKVETPAEEIFRLVNEARLEQGLKLYTYNTILETSATDYALLMRKDSCFSHTECGSTLKDRMHASGYYQNDGNSYYYGENIARGQDSPKEAFDDWMDSPPHREAILSTNFSEIGIGVSGDYWVQHFGAVK